LCVVQAGDIEAAVLDHVQQTVPSPEV